MTTLILSVVALVLVIRSGIKYDEAHPMTDEEWRNSQW